MKKHYLLFGLMAFLLLGLLSDQVLAKEEWISDILANPSRYWNVEVTVTGDVQVVNANPPGTTRGTYAIVDDSSDQPIGIRTRDLPQVGRRYEISGVVMQDPNNAAVPVINETSRSEAGRADWQTYLLIGGGAAFLILLGVFFFLLMRPSPKAEPPQAAQPTVRPATAPAGGLPTTRVSPPTQAVSPARGAATEIFTNLGGELTVNRGPDQGQEFILHKPVTTIGRSGSRPNDIELADSTVSRDQASILYDGGTREFSLKNESTTNPTRLNEATISTPTKLKTGDLIEMGKTILRFNKT